MTNAMQKFNAQPASLVDVILDNSLRRFFDGNLWDVETTGRSNTAPVNVRETDQQYEVDVIAPGCRKEDFKIQVHNNQLQISFTHDESKNQRDEKAGWVRNEYMQRSFTRSFTLDESVNTDNISATYTDGILKLVLPKSEKAKPRLLDISVK